jgi:hypothetical protein
MTPALGHATRQAPRRPRVGRALAVGPILALLLVAVPAVAVARTNATADEGQLDGVTWPSSRAFARLRPAQHLDVIDGTRLPPDQQVMFATLEGLINRREPRIYVLQPAGEGKTTWLDTLNLPHSAVADPFQLIARYHAEIQGMVVTDPAVQATVNVATTIAALDGAIVVSPRLADQLASSEHLAIRDDLRGRFTDDLAAYTWAVDNLWPKTTHRILAALGPGQRADQRDYVMATRTLDVWLSIARPGERALLERILRDMPPNSIYAGWFSRDAGANETLSTTFYSQHGVSIVPTALFANFSVFAGLPANLSAPQPAAPDVALGNKVYLTFTMSDGGNFGLLQHRMRMLWADPARGRVPINWTMHPLIADLAPRVFDYYRHTATPDDYFLACTTGAGYIYPSYWPADALRPYTEQTGRYMRETGLTVLDLQNRGAPLPPEAATRFVEDAAPLGIDLLQRNAPPVTIVDGTTPEVHGYFVSRPEQLAGMVERAGAGWDGRSPRFVSIFLVAWNFTPTDIASFASSLAPQYQPLRADTFFRLLRQWKNLPPR